MPPNAMQIAKLKNKTNQRRHYVCIMSCCLTCANYHLNQHRLVCRAGKSITHNAAVEASADNGLSLPL